MTPLPHSHLWYSCSVRAVGPSSLQKVLCHRKTLLKPEVPWFGGKVSWFRGKVILLFLIVNSGLIFRVLTEHHFTVYWLKIAVQAGHLELLHGRPCSSTWEWRRQEVPAHFLPLDWMTAWLWCQILSTDQYGTWQVLGPMQTEWKDSTGWRGHC